MNRRRWPWWLNGTWQPATIAGRDSALLTGVLGAQAAIRGVDYLDTGSTTAGQARTLSVVEEVLPLAVWGAAFLTSAVLIGIGALIAYCRIVAAGHVLAALCYIGVSAGTGLAVLEAPGGLDGFRTPCGLLAAALLHFLIAVRTRITPFKEGIRVMRERAAVPQP